MLIFNGAASVLRELYWSHYHTLPLEPTTDRLFWDARLSSALVHLDTKWGGFNFRPSNCFRQRKGLEGEKDVVSPLLPLVVLF